MTSISPASVIEAAPTSQPSPSPLWHRPWRRAGGSFTLLILAMLTATYALLWTFYPWRPLAELDVPGWIVDFADQVDLMMTSRNPQIVVLGSSLTLAAPRRLRKPDVYQEEISKKVGQKLTVSCMAVPGAIASDQDFILEQLLAHDKKPKLIVYTYAVRDFMDNTIEGKISTTPTRRVLTFIDRRASFWPKTLTWASFSQTADNHAAFLDLVRRHVLRSARSWACKFSGHPDSLWAAAQKQNTSKTHNQTVETSGLTSTAAHADGQDTVDADEDPAIRAKALTKDLELYGRRYNPTNPLRADEQYNHLQNLLSLAKRNGIQVTLVGMPLSPANLALLKPGVYANMQKRIEGLATIYGASLSDLNAIGAADIDNHFSQNEYLDSVHLSTPGARHYMPIFVQSVVGSTSFKKAFATAK